LALVRGRQRQDLRLPDGGAAFAALWRDIFDLVIAPMRRIEHEIGIEPNFAVVSGHPLRRLRWALLQRAVV
jgi:hypothetical protein